MSRTVGSDKDGSFDAYGHNEAPKTDYSKPFPDCCPQPVPHRDIDTDQLRKQTNRERHSSYRK